MGRIRRVLKKRKQEKQIQKEVGYWRKRALEAEAAIVKLVKESSH